MTNKDKWGVRDSVSGAWICAASKDGKYQGPTLMDDEDEANMAALIVSSRLKSPGRFVAAQIPGEITGEVILGVLKPPPLTKH